MTTDGSSPGHPVRVSSPQGRFAADAAVVDGAVLERYEAYGKHLFTWWSTGHVGHVHLGLFGKFRVHRGDLPLPRPTVRMRIETAADRDADRDRPHRADRVLDRHRRRA